MRWPRTRNRLARDNAELIALLEREREMHLQHLLDVIEITGTNALHIGNAGERVWPEALDQWRDLARERGATLLIVSGAGRTHGVYGVAT